MNTTSARSKLKRQNKCQQCVVRLLWDRRSNTVPNPCPTPGPFIPPQPFKPVPNPCVVPQSKIIGGCPSTWSWGCPVRRTCIRRTRCYRRRSYCTGLRVPTKFGC